MAADEGGGCPDEGRAMRSSPLRLQAQRFGCRHSQPPIEFPCSAPQRDGKSPKMTGHPADVDLKALSDFSPARGTITGGSQSAGDAMMRTARGRAGASHAHLDLILVCLGKSKSGALQRYSASSGDLDHPLPWQRRFAIAESDKKHDAGRKFSGIRRMPAKAPSQE